MLIRLRNGRRVVIRPIRAGDKQLLSDGLSRLSPESRHARFLTLRSQFSSDELRYLTEVDGVRHVALVAVAADDPQRLLGVGRYIRLADDPATAEIAIAVADELQGASLGGRLGLLLADHARGHGIKRFVATLLSDNVAAHRLLARISDRLSSESHSGVDELVGELAA